MARAKFEFLSRDEIENIHAVSLRILSEVGVLIHSQNVAKLLVNNGATSTKDGKRTLISESMVKEALKSAPKSLLLASRDGKKDMRIPDSDRMFVCNGGEGVHVTDMLTGSERPSTLEDLEKFLRLLDALPPVDFCWGMVGALDQPARLKGLVELKAVFENTTKHFQGGANDSWEARGMIDLASVIAGGKDALAKRPVFSSVQCPISPLTFEDGLVEAQVEFAKAGIPVIAMAAAVAGLTSPVTLSGTIAQVNAENLASAVISQTAKKGAPWIYSSDSVPGNLTTGSIDYGSMEAPLLRTGAGQMGKFYGLPTMVSGIGIESSTLLLGSVQEGVPHMVVQAMVPSDLASGLGGLDQAAGASYEQLVADAWIWDSAREFVRKFSADAAAISFETIREAGMDGNFLGKRHTVTRFKKEFVSTVKKETQLSSHRRVAKPGDLLIKARQEVDRILGGPNRPKSTKEESARMSELIKNLR